MLFALNLLTPPKFSLVHEQPNIRTCIFVSHNMSDAPNDTNEKKNGAHKTKNAVTKTNTQMTYYIGLMMLVIIANILNN